VYTTHDNACSYADRHVGGEAPRTRCTSGEISHYAFLSGGRHYFTYCRRRRTARPVLTAFANFSSTGKKGTAGQFGVGHMCARVYTVTLTLLLQFNAFHRQAGPRALKIRARARRRTTARPAHEPKFFRIYDPRETFIFPCNGAAETRNRICKRIYRCPPLCGRYIAEIFCSRADD